jgi:hypothetical protein
MYDGSDTMIWMSVMTGVCGWVWAHLVVAEGGAAYNGSAVAGKRAYAHAIANMAACCVHK